MGMKVSLSWELVLEEVKQKESLNDFEDAIKRMVISKLPM